MQLFPSFSWQASRDAGEVAVFDDPPRLSWSAVLELDTEDDVSFFFDDETLFFLHVDAPVVTPPPASGGRITPAGPAGIVGTGGVIGVTGVYSKWP